MAGPDYLDNFTLVHDSQPSWMGIAVPNEPQPLGDLVLHLSDHLGPASTAVCIDAVILDGAHQEQPHHQEGGGGSLLLLLQGQSIPSPRAHPERSHTPFGALQCGSW